MCSSWVWMCRHTTGRSELNVMGRGSATTLNANIMVSRVVLLFRLAVARGAAAIIEQPVSSLMYLHDRFQDLSLGGHETVFRLCLVVCCCLRLVSIIEFLCVLTIVSEFVSGPNPNLRLGMSNGIRFRSDPYKPIPNLLCRGSLYLHVKAQGNRDLESAGGAGVFWSRFSEAHLSLL